ncbi:MAG: response regulator [Anaerolineaceae bacterium]|nr:response regulator [Anaerolineaceae bacterium]
MTKILVTDDSSFARNSLCRTLEGAGYEVFQADSGQAAIDQITTIVPDVVTLDLLMPGLSGNETLVELLKIHPTAIYIIVTADIQESTQKELMAAGANAFLNKPVKANTLLEKISQLLAEK